LIAFAFPSGWSFKAGATHQQLDLVVSQLDTSTEGELGVDPAGALDAMALGVERW
jgi:hypothetical protein